MRSIARLFLMATLLGGCHRTKALPPIGIDVQATAGTFDVHKSGELIFQHATADVLFDSGDGPDTASCTDNGFHAVDAAGALHCVTHQLELALSFETPAGERHFTARLTATNRSSAPITVLRLAPMVVDTDHGGALWLGRQAEHHRILENGQFILLDQSAQLRSPVATPLSVTQALPIPMRGNSVSNWNHIVTDLDSGRSLVAGYLTFERSVPTLGIAPGTAANGQLPFGYWAESVLPFHGKTLAPGESVASEKLYVEMLPSDPVEALEHYADVVARTQHITPWPKRGPGHAVPVNWCSWSGGSGTGGYGQSIDTSLIQQNLDVYARELQPFGANTFELDDGWQPRYGDWTFRADTFPGGATSEVSAIDKAALLPGLWTAPFSAAPDSALAQAHPDWLQPAEDGIVGVFGKDRQTLDLSNPAVRDYVAQLYQGQHEQGWKWAKGDFSYFALLGKPQFDRTLTNVESWRGGWQVIRDALGPDVFLVSIGVMGSNIGRIDSMRLTTDNGPQWDESDADNAIANDRAFKATVRTGTRRWFYQNRIWVNHDDMIFFRPSPDSSVPPLSLEETRTFATWIALGGGLVELGDKVLDVGQHPEWIDILRRLMPVWPDGARPLDVMTRDYPEQYRQHIAAPAGTWDNVGLINWGTNRDWSQTPPAPMPEATRSYRVTCEGECLAYEFWSEAFLGRFTGGFDVSVDPRRAKVIAVRAPVGVPQLLGTDRHVTQGATDQGAITWDSSKRTLSGTVQGAVGTAAAPWTYRMAFYAPPGFTLDHAAVGGSTDASAQQKGEVIRLSFTLTASAQGSMAPWTMVFR